MHGTAPAYLSDSLRPTLDIVAVSALLTADAVNSLGYPWRPCLSGGCGAGMVQSATRDSGLLLTFDIPKRDKDLFVSYTADLALSNLMVSRRMH